MRPVLFLGLLAFLLACGRSPVEDQAPEPTPPDTCACYPDERPPRPLGIFPTMRFEGREVPEAEFRAMARRAFQAELDAQDQAVRDAKAGAWFHRSPAAEQELFAQWLRGLGVDSFPFREPDPLRPGRPGRP